MATDGTLDRVGRAARQAFAAVLLVLLVPDMAAAEPGTRTCRQLEAALAGLPAGGRAAPAQARRYDEAIGRQRDEIAKARAQARRAGCDFAVMGGAAAYCGQINATLARMDKNLAQLQRKRTQLGGGGDTRRERGRILASLDANDCRAPKRTTPAESRSGTILFPAAPRARDLSGNLRTLCVRTCDGYYFPISWSVSQAAFERDGKACQAMCPGTQVELHYHRIADQEPQDMVSAATGLPYRQMSTAFLYKRPGASVPAGCGCGATAQQPPGFQTIGGDYESNDPAGSGDAQAGDATLTAAIPQPSQRPDPAEDPETLATREGGLDAEALQRLATPPARAGKPGEQAGERQVRVVGPAFLPDPEAAADRPAPAPVPAP